MNILSRLRLRAKLGLLLVLSAVAMIAIAALGAMTLHQRMLDDRAEKLRAIVSSTVAIASALEARTTAQEITRQQALDIFHQNIRAIRYDHGTGYIAVTDLHTGNVLMHGVNPALEGKPNPTDLATGKPISYVLLYRGTAILGRSHRDVYVPKTGPDRATAEIGRSRPVRAMGRRNLFRCLHGRPGCVIQCIAVANRRGRRCDIADYRARRLADQPRYHGLARRPEDCDGSIGESRPHR